MTETGRVDLQESDSGVMRIRNHVDGCAAPFIGNECACPPEEVWVLLSVAEALADALEGLRAGNYGPSKLGAADRALAAYREVHPRPADQLRKEGT